MKQLDSKDILSGPANLRVRPGQYAGFVLRVNGTNQSGQTLATSHLGLITMSWRNVTFGSVKFADLALMNALQKGVVETASASGGAFALSCFIPASWVADGNIFDVAADDQVIMTVDLATVTGTIVANGTITLLGVPAQGAMAYLPRLSTFTPTVIASGQESPVIGGENYVALFINGVTNASRVDMTLDSQQFVQATVAELLGLSNYDADLESSTPTTNLMIRLARSGTAEEQLSDNMQLTLYAGSGGNWTPSCVVIWSDFAPDLYRRSKVVWGINLKTALDRKRRLQKTRSIAAISELRGENLEAAK